jgi:glyoxylase-like metal-dependent hydrolase (beta-lactamase superfamily II)
MKSSTYQFKLSDLQCSVISDFERVQSADELIPNADQEQLEQVALEFDLDLDKITLGYNCLLINTGEQTILVDAGFGELTQGNLHQGLEALGYSPGDIDVIILTHSDYDHIGGVLDEEGQAVFPNARYFVLKDAWDFWSSPEKRSELKALNDWPEEKIEYGWRTFSEIRNLLTPVEPEEEFLPGFRLIPAPGHRYDHAALKIASAGKKLLHIGDAMTHPLFMAVRDWYSAYDSVPEQAVATRLELLAWCVSENALMFGAHFPFPGVGHVKQQGGGWQWNPMG